MRVVRTGEVQRPRRDRKEMVKILREMEKVDVVIARATAA